MNVTCQHIQLMKAKSGALLGCERQVNIEPSFLVRDSRKKDLQIIFCISQLFSIYQFEYLPRARQCEVLGVLGLKSSLISI